MTSGSDVPDNANARALWRPDGVITAHPAPCAAPAKSALKALHLAQLLRAHGLTVLPAALLILTMNVASPG